jgi:hypothetical protein
MYEALHQHKGEQGKAYPPYPPKGLHTGEKPVADMVNQHGNKGDNLQRGRGHNKTLLFSYYIFSFLACQLSEYVVLLYKTM